MSVFYVHNTTIECDRCGAIIAIPTFKTYAIDEARMDGWVIGRKGEKAICPKCKKEAKA